MLFRSAPGQGAGGGADGAEPATAAFPSDPSFLRAREERLAARNGASLRKKPNFEELAQAFEEELEQEERAAQGSGAQASDLASGAASANGAAEAAALSDAGKSGVIDLDNTVPWDEEEDLGPDEYFERASDSPTAEGDDGSSHGAHAAPGAGDDGFDDEPEDEPALAFNGPASLPIIGAAAGQGTGAPAHGAHAAPAEGAPADGSASAADAPAASQPGSGTAVMPEAAAPSSSADNSAPAADAADEDEDDADEPLTSAFDSIPAIVEARLIAGLNDPNIVTVYDCQESEGRAYIIMEFVDGLTLAQLLDKVGDQITLEIGRASCRERV